MGLWDQTVPGNQPDPSSDRRIPQDAGEIFIDGAPVYENKQVKAQMAYIPDEPFYFLQADTLEMMRYFRGMYESFDEKMFYRLQEFSRD